MNEAEFSRMKAAAVEQMREMNARSVKETGKSGARTVPTLTRTGSRNGGSQRGGTHAPPVEAAPPVFTKGKTANGFFGGLDLPFLDRLKNEGDLALILGLLLILWSESADKRLLFALLYILL